MVKMNALKTLLTATVISGVFGCGGGEPEGGPVPPGPAPAPVDYTANIQRDLANCQSNFLNGGTNAYRLCSLCVQAVIVGSPSEAITTTDANLISQVCSGNQPSDGFNLHSSTEFGPIFN